MKLIEKIKEIYPDDVTIRGMISACPVYYHEIRKTLPESVAKCFCECPCHEDGTEMDCNECWDREYIEKE